MSQKDEYHDHRNGNYLIRQIKKLLHFSSDMSQKDEYHDHRNGNYLIRQIKKMLHFS